MVCSQEHQPTIVPVPAGLLPTLQLVQRASAPQETSEVLAVVLCQAGVVQLVEDTVAPVITHTLGADTKPLTVEYRGYIHEAISQRGTRRTALLLLTLMDRVVVFAVKVKGFVFCISYGFVCIAYLLHYVQVLVCGFVGGDLH